MSIGQPHPDDPQPSSLEDRGPHLALIGSPIAHSLSPYIYNCLRPLLIEQKPPAPNPHLVHPTYPTRPNPEKAKYLLIECEKAPCLDALFQCFPLAGINVTAPHKGAFAQQALYDETATRTGVVNCIRPIQHNESLPIDNPLGLRFIATNTDTHGALRMLTLAQEKLAEKGGIQTLCLWGAGGATRAIIEAAQRLSISKIYCTNRTIQKILNLKNEHPGITPINYSQLNDLPEGTVILSALPRTILPDAHPIPWNRIALFLNANYSDPIVEEKVRQHAIPYQDGWPWLLAQAIAAYQFFFSIALPNSLPLGPPAPNDTPPPRTIQTALTGSTIHDPKPGILYQLY